MFFINNLRKVNKIMKKIAYILVTFAALFIKELKGLIFNIYPDNPNYIKCLHPIYDSYPIKINKTTFFESTYWTQEFRVIYGGLHPVKIATEILRLRIRHAD